MPVLYFAPRGEGQRRACPRWCHANEPAFRYTVGRQKVAGGEGMQPNFGTKLALVKAAWRGFPSAASRSRRRGLEPLRARPLRKEQIVLISDSQ